MSLKGDDISNLYYSQNNLDNTFKQVSDEIVKRTSKDISQNSAYRITFNKMATIVYDKCPPLEKNLTTVNSQLVDKSVTYFHSKIFEKNVNKQPTEKQMSNRKREEVLSAAQSTNTESKYGFTMLKENEDINNKYNEIMSMRGGDGNPNTYLPQPVNPASSYINVEQFTRIKQANPNQNPNTGRIEMRPQSIGDGNPNSYLPQPMNPASSYVKNEVFNKGAQNNNIYEGQFKRVADDDTMSMRYNNNTQSNQPRSDFTIKPFNLSDDMTDSLFGSENVDSPLYQNIENLQKMESANPMSLLEDYQKQRNQQVQTQAKQKVKSQSNFQNTRDMSNSDMSNSDMNFGNMNMNNITMNNDVAYSVKRQGTQNSNPQNTYSMTNTDQTIVDPNDLTDLGNELTQRFIDKIETKIINDNKAQPKDDMSLAQMQEALIKLQRETQPKYIEKVHYININSVDRDWEKNAESRFQFQVKFNQSNTFTGAGISQLYRNVVSVELVSAILPMDASILPFDTRIYNGLMKYPYLLLRIDELDSVFRGTNNWVDRAFSTLLFDKVFFSNVLSTDYISGTTTSIVNSTPKQGFASEYLRGFMKYNPAYFEKKKFYNNPLASLNRMSISITDPRGNFINTQSDVLIMDELDFTVTLNNIGNTLDLDASNAFPYSTQSDFKMIKITTSTYFSNRLFRIGDRIIIRNYETNISLAANNSIFNSFINRPEGHTIINLELETDGNTDTNNRGFLNKLYISPPGIMNEENKTVDPATSYDDETLDFTGATQGTLINIDLQTHLLFRIVTREPDTSTTLQPINIY
jgi:hypothetical protein